ncbi:hypothetical protein LCGC14_0587820 [marine sediment metagenome]|uniref:Uncharacterized protein n=1 Tax=marine sediment metagenome TaxID=412755 RepID=A0A0F9RJG6_9ZZZZ
MKLPRILDKEIDAELATLQGRQRIAARDHRERLILAHVYGRHTEVIEGCPECALDWALFIEHVSNRPRNVLEFFR